MLNRVKRFFSWLYTSVLCLFYGLRGADKAVFGKDSSGDGSGSNIEVQDEEKSVYKDLLKGEITQEVRELRHEMYYSERESHKYKYAGNGTAVKVNTVFDGEVEGIDRSDGLKVLLIQDNKEDTGGVYDNLQEADYTVKDRREFTIKIDRKFIPRFRLEEYATKVVVKDAMEDGFAVIDVYVTKYESQFNRRHRPFLNEMERIYMGDVQSDVIDFDSLSFITYKAYGAEDLKIYKFTDISYETIGEYNGCYVLKFYAKIAINGDDILDEFYDKVAARKFENHERRDGVRTISMDDAVLLQNKPKYDLDEAERALQEAGVIGGD